MVEVLLRNDALTNVADSKGCYPLHLAAWKGDAQIVRLLIHQGPSHTRVNEQVGSREAFLPPPFSRTQLYPAQATHPHATPSARVLGSLLSLSQCAPLSALLLSPVWQGDPVCEEASSVHLSHAVWSSGIITVVMQCIMFTLHAESDIRKSFRSRSQLQMAGSFFGSCAYATGMAVQLSRCLSFLHEHPVILCTSEGAEVEILMLLLKNEFRNGKGVNAAQR